MLIRSIDNFLSPEECDYIITQIEKNNQRSSVANGSDERSVVENSRTSYTSNLNGSDKKIKTIHQRIADELKLDIKRGESLQGQKYEPGQYFRSHTDYFEGKSYDDHCLSSGNRSHTFMIYLNQVEEGGETNFHKLDLKFTPKKGTAILWTNLDKEGNVIPDALHEGSDVIKGTKYIVTAWFRENEWNGAEDTRLGEERRKAKADKITFADISELPAFTETGFTVVDVPKESWDVIKEAYELVKDKKTEEVFQGKESIIKGEGITSDLLSLDHIPSIRAMIHKLLQPLHEEWSGQPITPSAVYGFRSYNKGAVLAQHTDRPATHHISSIIIVDKELAGGKDWPLDIQDHNGNWHKVYAQPGQIILYESAKLSHGRDEPFEGTFFRNFFVHYKLNNYEYTGNIR